MRLISSRPCFCASRFINQTPKQSFLQGLSDENKTDKTTRYLEEHKGPTYSSGSYFFGGTGKMDHQNLGLVFFLTLGDF